jgi:repressor LexA
MSDTKVSSDVQTVDVPLIGTVACGLPILAEQNIEAMYPVSTKLAPPSNKYFLLRAKGNSMDKKDIHDGDLVLVKQKSTAEDGDIIVALIDDSATIKEFRRRGGAVVLVPHSTEEKHKPMILTSDFLVQGVVVATIPKI